LFPIATQLAGYKPVDVEDSLRLARGAGLIVSTFIESRHVGLENYWPIHAIRDPSRIRAIGY
jgi:hypothetical protein